MPCVGQPYQKKKKIPYPFYCTAYDYSHADLDSLCNHLRDAPWKDIFKLSASAIEFCKWVPVGILVVAKFEIQLDLASELEPTWHCWLGQKLAC